MSRERRVHPSRLDSSDLPIVRELLSNVFSPGEPVRVLKVESPNLRVHRIDALIGGRRRCAFVKRSHYGPMSLLHGDLYASNIVIDVQRSAGEAGRARIVDWDRAGAGPIAFDLAFLIGDIAPLWRRDSLRAYARRMQRHLSPWPSEEAWQQRFHRIALGRMVRAVSTCLDPEDQGQQDYAMEARWPRSS